MKTSIFVSFCLLIVAGLISLHAFFGDSVSPVEELKQRLSLVEKSREEADLRAQILASELADYQQHVATLLPDAIKGKDEQTAYPLRQLASVAGDGAAEGLEIERASSLFESAKGDFRDKKYEKAVTLLERLITRYPVSGHVVEAYFLLAEAQFQLKDYPASVTVIERMIDAYPENELTGFALLRLGQIFETQDRLEDAGDIYRAVLTNFQQPTLVKQANVSLQAVAL